jgi:hypothetical protein
MLWDEADKRTCCELTRDILAFANSPQGGCVIVGKDDVTAKVLGVSPEQAASFDPTRVSRFVNNYAAPHVDLAIHRVAVEDKICVVIQVPAFATTPHICQKDYPNVLRAGGIYVRTASKQTAQVTDPQEMSEVIERAVRNRANALLRDIDLVLRTGTGTPATPSDIERFEEQAREADAGVEELVAETHYQVGSEPGWLRVVSFPASFSADRFAVAGLRQVAERAAVRLSGIPFPLVSDDPARTYAIQGGIEGVYASSWQNSFDCWQLRSSGLFVHRSRLWEDAYGPATGKRNPILAYERLIQHTVLAAAFTGQLYELLGVERDENITLRLGIRGCKGRQLLALDRMCVLADPFPEEHICRVDSVDVTQSLTVAEWIARLPITAVELLKGVLRLFNCDVRDEVLHARVAKLMPTQRRP